MIRSSGADRRRQLGQPFLGVLSSVALALTLAPLEVNGAEWSVTSTVSEKVEFDDNIRLRTNNAQDVVGSSTSATIDLRAESRDYDFTFSGGASARGFVGRGGSSDLDTFDQNVKGDLELQRSTYKAGLRASVKRQDATFTDTVEEFEELGVTAVTDRLSYSAGGDVTFDINSSHVLSAGASISATDFDNTNSQQTPFSNVGVTAGWRTDLSDSTKGELAGSAIFFDADNAQDSESQTYELVGKVTSQIDEQLTVWGQIGVSLTNTEQSVGAARRSDSSVGSLFHFGFDYALDVTNITLSVSQNVVGTALGNVERRRRIFGAVNHQINRSSSVGVQAYYADQDSVSSPTGGGSATRTFVSVEPTYSVQLARYWRFLFGYGFRYQTRGGGDATSNKVFGVLTRDFVLKP